MKKLGWALLAAILGGSLAFAQMMGGGMMAPPRSGSGSVLGPGSNASGTYLQMFQAMSSTGAMGSGMGVGMTDDLTVDTDGTAYVIRAVAAAQTGTLPAFTPAWQYELMAISPVDGSLKWKLQIPGGRISQPVLASDGRIFLTVDDYEMFYANYVAGGRMVNPAQAQSNTGQLVIVSHTSSSASIQSTIAISSDVLSAPRIAADAASGGYMIYVMGYDMMSWTQTAAIPALMFAPGNKVLYAYRPDGSLKFSVQLAQVQATP